MGQINLLTYTMQTHVVFFNPLVRMEYIGSLVPNLRTWQNQSYIHVAVINLNQSHQWSLPELADLPCISVSLASQQCRQTGNLANSVMYKLHKQRAYIYMTHHVLQNGKHSSLPILLHSGELYHASFMLCSAMHMISS